MKDISRTAVGKITGGHMLARALKDKGVERIFSLCGGFINPATIGCLDYGIDVVSVRNEMEAGFMAAATARLTREVAVVLAEPSGFTNYVSAVAEAFYAGDPVMFIGISANTNNFDNKAFKEMPQAEVVRCMTKYSIEVNDPTRIAWFFDKAYDIAMQHPTGPVQLTIPTNFLFTGKIDAAPKPGARTFDPTRKKVHQPYPNPADLEMVAEALNAAKNPVIMAGADVWFSHADTDLAAFAAAANIPIFTPFTHIKPMNMSTAMHMGLLDYHQNPCSRLVGEEADVILMLGGQLDFPVNFGEAPLIGENTRLITVNATARELSNNMLAQDRVCANIQTFVQAIAKGGRIKPASSDWVSRLRQRRSESIDEVRKHLTDASMPVHPMRMCYDVLCTLGEDDILVVDGGDIACWCEIALNAWVMEGRKIANIIAPGPWEQMGTGPAFATAVKMARPNARVVLITGDGSIGLAPGLTPLETALDRGVAVTVVIANNAQWGMIKNQQKAMWGREIGTSLREMDYSKIFAAAGAHAELVTDADQVGPAIRRAWAADKAACIEVKTKPEPSLMTTGLVEMRVRTAIE